MKEKIKQLYREGNPTYMIALMLGITESKVVNVLEDAGLI